MELTWNEKRHAYEEKGRLFKKILKIAYAILTTVMVILVGSFFYLIAAADYAEMHGF